jgi:hypothetical protein
MLSDSYGELYKHSKNIYKSDLHTLRFYTTERERAKSIDTINVIYKYITGEEKEYLPKDTLTWLNPELYVSIYRHIEDTAC